MKSKRFLTLGLAFTLLVGSVGCGSKAVDDSKSEDKVITVGASVSPHAEILEVAKANLEKEGYTLKIVEYNDYVLPNTALESGELDANYFQHQPYLDDFNKENNTNIVSAGSVHFEPFGIYAGKSNDIKALKEGSVVAVPNDTTNEARALLLLESQGLIKLKEGSGLSATILDIESNPLKLDIKEIEAAQIVRSLQDVDIACVNGNYAIDGGLSVKDALAVESADSLAAETYANIIAVKAGNEESDKTKALKSAILSDDVRKYIEETYSGAVLPVF